MRTQSGNFFRNRPATRTPYHRVYVLANRTSAVLYEDRPSAPFVFLERLKNPKGHLTEGQLDSDRPGSGFSSAGSGTIRHGLDKTFHHHEAAAERFAHAIAVKLRHRLQKKKLDELILVAEPRFLGYLRRAMSDDLRKTIHHEIHREYNEGSDLEMKAAIDRALGRRP